MSPKIPRNSSLFAHDSDDPARLAQALRESHELLALAEQSAGIGIWDTDLATDTVRATPTFFRIMGLPVSAEPIANDIVRAVRHPDDAARVRDGFRQAVARGLDSYEVEYRIIRPVDGELRWIFGRGRTVRDSAGKPVRYSGVDIDITERKQAEEHVRLLLAELNHRANNLLTVIQAIARQTANTADPKIFAERLSQRIAGLAASNDLLVSGKWQGVEIGKLIDSQLSHFVDLGARVVLDGPPVRLTPGAAQALGMALHELATNAVKHGALANEAGRIHIRWSIAEGLAEPEFRMDWSERDGPPVATPRRTGFGRTVMERMVAGTLDGTAALQFAATGIVWSFACPARRALEDAGRA
jgi:PAS domain S-box-containing protein